MSNESSDNQSSGSIRDNIDQTRENMDQTIDALADRFQGKHLLDEVVGFFRSNAETAAGRASEIKDRVSDTTNRAVSSIVGTVKRHPVPTALIGAGAAYIIYKSVQASRDHRPGASQNRYDNEYYESSGYALKGEEYIPIDLDEYASRQADDSAAAKLHRKLNEAKATLNSASGRATGTLRSAANRVTDKVKQGTEAARQRAGEIGSRVKDSTREVYEQGRDQVVNTVHEHPVEVGLGLLALGLIVGLALPTPRRVNQVVGARADRLRKRAQEVGLDLVDRGKNVARAAANAAREEAHSQGLTPTSLASNSGAGSRGADRPGSSGRTEGSVAFAAESQPGQASVDGLQSSSAAEI